MAVRITRRNPRTGRIELPWRNRDGLFPLADPAHGARRHHDKFAVKVKTIEEVAALVGRGFPVRMTDGDTPPSLISPDSLTVETVDDASPASLWAETRPRPPFIKADMLAELKRVLLVQANQIAHAGSLDFAVAFMGFETGNPLYPYCKDDPGKVDLGRFNATGYLDQAYDFAFQVGAALALRRRNGSERRRVGPRCQPAGEQRRRLPPRQIRTACAGGRRTPPSDGGSWARATT